MTAGSARTEASRTTCGRNTTVYVPGGTDHAFAKPSATKCVAANGCVENHAPSSRNIPNCRGEPLLKTHPLLNIVPSSTTPPEETTIVPSVGSRSFPSAIVAFRAIGAPKRIALGTLASDGPLTIVTPGGEAAGCANSTDTSAPCRSMLTGFAANPFAASVVEGITSRVVSVSLQRAKDESYRPAEIRVKLGTYDDALYQLRTRSGSNARKSIVKRAQLENSLVDAEPASSSSSGSSPYGSRSGAATMGTLAFTKRLPA